MTRKANRLRFHTLTAMNKIELTYPSVNRVTEVLINDRCLDYITNSTLLDNNISKIHLFTIQFNMLQEAREVVNQLHAPPNNFGFSLLRLRNSYIKSLMCEISMIMHILEQPVPLHQEKVCNCVRTLTELENMNKDMFFWIELRNCHGLFIPSIPLFALMTYCFNFTKKKCF